MKTLIRILIFSLLISFLLPIFPAKAENELEKGPVWLSAGGQKSSDLSNQSQAKTVSDNTLDVVITFPGVWADVQYENGADFTKLWHEEYGSYREPGQPALPGKMVNILIPNGAQVEVLSQTVTSEKFRLSDYALPTTIIPAQIQVSKSEPPPPWTQPDPKHYGNQNVFPQNWYELKDTFHMRDYTILPIWINPVRYSPGKGELEILEQIELRLTWQTSSLDRTKRVVVSDSPSFDRLVSQIVINPPELLAYDTKDGAGEGYLIITPDIFYDELQPFVNMKESQGYVVEVVLLSEIEGFVGSIDSEITDIKAIQKFINLVDPSPVYLLLVGDTNLIPAPEGDVTNLKTDLYYATLGNEDYVPDIYVGRIPAQNETEIINVIEKLVSYSSEGYQNWHAAISFIATCDPIYYPVAEGSHNYVINNYTSLLNFIGDFPEDESPSGGDQLYCKTNYALKEDVISRINLGRGIITYSGHGMSSAWYDGVFTIYDYDLDNLIENNTSSFVSSFACSTNNFGSISDPKGFGETWMTIPKKGAVAYLGSAALSYWYQDNIMEISMFDHLYSNPLNPPSVKESINFGLLALEEKYLNLIQGGFQYYLESYNLLGDPSQKLWLVPNNRVFMPVIYK